jgi:nucleotide-binding universal stress UspA family protein
MRILIATDGSNHSEAAIASFLARPWPERSPVLVVSVASGTFPLITPFPVTPYPGPGMVNIDVLKQSQTKEAQSTVDRTVARLQSAGFLAEGVVRSGDPPIEIVQAADEWKAGMVIVGSHGRTGIPRWLLGSVAEYVVRHCRCSVEVAR